MNIRLQARSDLHLMRKVWHLGMGLIILGIYYFSEMTRAVGAGILIFFFCLTLLIETARLKSPEINEKLVKLWRPIMRSSEVNSMTGIPFYLASSILSIALFPREVATLAILSLAVVDPIASLFGLLYGDLSIRLSHGKSLVGTMAGVLAVAAASFIMCHIMGVPGNTIGAISVVAGISAAGAELIPTEIDDNFTIPMVSGFAIWGMFLVLGIH